MQPEKTGRKELLFLPWPKDNSISEGESTKNKIENESLKIENGNFKIENESIKIANESLKLKMEASKRNWKELVYLLWNMKPKIL